MRVYLAGPMRNRPLFNFPAFDEAAYRLRSLGHDVVNPADLDRAEGFDPATSVPDDAFLRRALSRDLVAITSCDAIALLPGWQDSEGARLELSLAKMLGLAVLDAETAEPFTDKQTFATGAVRDTLDGKPRLELISPLFLNRLGAWLAEGAKKYADRNWERGIPADRSMGSLLRHINAHREGLTDEDHMAAAACNVMFIIHTEEMVKRGKLPAELANIPHYI
jgi:hypothetical protein